MNNFVHSRRGDLLPNESVKVDPSESRSKMKIDGTITYGNILAFLGALVSVGIAWGVLTSQVNQQQREFTAAIGDIREAQKEQRGELKELQKSINMITTDTALIRGRLASGDNTVRTK